MATVKSKQVVRDHRQIPGITFLPCPGPLRVGDYHKNKNAWFGGPPIWIVSDIVETHNRVNPDRVIPVISPLQPPEPVDIDEVETGQAEVVTLNMNDDECWFMDNACIYAVAPDDDGWTFDDIARFSAKNARKKRRKK